MYTFYKKRIPFLKKNHWLRVIWIFFFGHCCFTEQNLELSVVLTLWKTRLTQVCWETLLAQYLLFSTDSVYKVNASNFTLLPFNSVFCNYSETYERHYFTFARMTCLLGLKQWLKMIWQSFPWNYLWNRKPRTCKHHFPSLKSSDCILVSVFGHSLRHVGNVIRCLHVERGTSNPKQSHTFVWGPCVTKRHQVWNCERWRYVQILHRSKGRSGQENRQASER